MACNLAVSITKAAVSNEMLQSLLTLDVIESVLTAYAQQQTGMTVRRTPTALVVQVGRVAVTVVPGGQVETTAPDYLEAESRAVIDPIAALLAQAADQRFAQQVQAALATLGSVSAQQVTVDNEGQAQTATVLTMQL